MNRFLTGFCIILCSLNTVASHLSTVELSSNSSQQSAVAINRTAYSNSTEVSKNAPPRVLKTFEQLHNEKQWNAIYGLLKNVSVETLIEILKYKQLTKALNASVIAKIKETISSVPTTPAPVKCPPHSSLTCPTRCDPTCKRPLSKRNSCPLPTICLQKECVCDDGYVKSDDGVCIQPINCSAKCHENEVFKLCPTACLVHCGNEHDPPKECTEDTRDDYQCLADCVCRQDLVRDLVTNLCVPRSNCSKVNPYPCPPNEHYEESGQWCEKYCHRVSTRTECKKDSKGRKGCFCNSGYIRLNLNTRCVREDECLLMLKYTQS